MLIEKSMSCKRKTTMKKPICFGLLNFFWSKISHVLVNKKKLFLQQCSINPHLPLPGGTCYLLLCVVWNTWFHRKRGSGVDWIGEDWDWDDKKGSCFLRSVWLKNSKKTLNESTFLAVEGFFPVSAFDIILS